MNELKGLFNKAIELAGQRDLIGAEQILNQILSIQPDEPNALRMLGSMKLADKDFVLAADYLQKTLQAAPDFATAQIELTQALHLSGDTTEALTSMRAFLDSNPGNQLVWQALANLLFELGDLKQGNVAAQRSVELDAFYEQTRGAIEALNSGNPKDAEDIFRKILMQDNNHIHALVGLASLAMDREVLEDAERLLRRVAVIAPNFSHVQRAWSRLHMKQSRYEPAEGAAKQAVRVSPESAECWTSLGTILAWGLKNREAADAFANSLKLEPNQPRVQMSLGHVLKAAGDFDGSIAAYKKSLDLDNYLGEAWWSLADLKTYRFDQSDLKQMLKVSDETEIKERARDHASLNFALGKAYEDLKDYSESFRFYALGNKLRSQFESFNLDRLRTQISASKEVYTDQVFRSEPSLSNPIVPIFVLGLPRSGSTLVDQILASHSQVQGTMELPHILSYVRELGGTVEERLEDTTGNSKYPSSVLQLSDQEKQDLGERYLKETENYHLGSSYFVDKMPNNFLHIGLIAQILPQAIFVDTRRHPLACCFSIFKQNFARGQSFSYDLETLGKYYECYLDLMEHWRTVLPGRLHRVIYEDMVDDTEQQIRNLLKHCGLEFEEGCLAFYENDRVVRTASAQQVRKPIYDTAKQAWQGFEDYLEPLTESLGTAIDGWRS